MDYRQLSLKKHYKWKGKLETKLRVKVSNIDQLSLAYTPGVAQPCLAIKDDVSKSFELTRRWNTVAVVTDGSAVLGLGDIGPEAAMPVMEGKCVLFKAFGGVDAVPICIGSKDVDEIVRTVELIAGSFGGINLEDISAPRCFEIESKLKQKLDIPVFHDDQHGTAIVAGAALINALRIVDKCLDSIRLVINGAGSAGIAIAKFMLQLGVKHITMVDRFGIICKGDDLKNPAHAEISHVTNLQRMRGTLEDALTGADVFIGVSAGNIVSQQMIKSMAAKPVVFALANPTPEISMELALQAGAAVVGTGASDKPNQINNALIFPGLFRGALDCRAKQITVEMQIAAAYALANLITNDQLKSDYIIPSPFDKRVAIAVAQAVSQANK